jgi:hypothetical protein
VAGDDGKRFRAVASNSQGAVNSAAATLTVTTPPQASGWQGVEVLGEGDDANWVRTVRNGNGQAAVLWTVQLAGGLRGLQVRRYDPVGGWGPVQSMAFPAFTFKGYLNAGMDNQGNVTAVWLGSDGGFGWERIWAARSTPGDGWGTPTMQPVAGASPVGSGQPYSGVAPVVAVHPAGGVTVLWGQYQATPNLGSVNLIAASFGPVGFGADGWGELQLFMPQTAGDMRLGVGPNGHAVLMWFTGTELRAAHFTADATDAIVGTSSTIEVAADPTVQQLSIAVDANGNAIVAWEEYDAAVSSVRVRVSRYSGSWEAPHGIHSSNTDIIRRAEVAFAPNGDALVSASAILSTGGNWRVVAARHTASGWGALQTVVTTASRTLSAAWGALDAQGAATVVYRDAGDFTAIHASRSVSGGAWSAPELISAKPNGVGSTSTLNLVGLPNGGVLATWAGFAVSPPYSIEANVFKLAP